MPLKESAELHLEDVRPGEVEPAPPDFVAQVLADCLHLGPLGQRQEALYELLFLNPLSGKINSGPKGSENFHAESQY